MNQPHLSGPLRPERATADITAVGWSDTVQLDHRAQSRGAARISDSSGQHSNIGGVHPVPGPGAECGSVTAARRGPRGCRRGVLDGANDSYCVSNASTWPKCASGWFCVMDPTKIWSPDPSVVTLRPNP